MKIERKLPPNFDKIKVVFPNLPSGVIFTYGDILYNPSKSGIPDHLRIHEKTHMVQQGDDPEGWWDRYLSDKEFRISQEVEAYRKQYRFFKSTCKIKSRIPTFLEKIVKDLSGMIYGNIIGFEEAKKLIDA